jgi:hypothetical protein
VSWNKGHLVRKASEMLDEKTDDGRRMMKMYDLNDMAFTVSVSDNGDVQ